MARKSKQKAPDDKDLIERIVGRHPRSGNLHRLSHYKGGIIKIQRADILSRNPVTNRLERQRFSTLVEKMIDHRWLWDTINQHQIIPWKSSIPSTNSVPGQASPSS